MPDTPDDGNNNGSNDGSTNPDRPDNNTNGGSSESPTDSDNNSSETPTHSDGGTHNDSTNHSTPHETHGENSNDGGVIFPTPTHDNNDSSSDSVPTKPNHSNSHHNSHHRAEFPNNNRDHQSNNIGVPVQPHRSLDYKSPLDIKSNDNHISSTSHNHHNGTVGRSSTFNRNKYNSNTYDDNLSRSFNTDSGQHQTTAQKNIEDFNIFGYRPFSDREKGNDDNQLIHRFKQMADGSFKYNPFILNQVKHLNKIGKVSNKDISSLLKRQRFPDNSFLNRLQQGTNYFKFQYFNPLKAKDYYENLDKQVLALVTGEIGSMPDLKENASSKVNGKYEYHTSSDQEYTQTTDPSKKDSNGIKFERTLFGLIIAIVTIFLGVLIGFFVKRKNDDKAKSTS